MKIKYSNDFAINIRLALVKDILYENKIRTIWLLQYGHIAQSPRNIFPLVTKFI